MSHCFGQITRKARKQHVCEICNGKIEPGHKYLNRTGVDCNQHWSLKMHHLCESITQNWSQEWYENWENFDNIGTLKEALAPATKKEHEYWAKTGSSKFYFLYGRREFF